LTIKIGEDSLEPFVKIARQTDKGLFILVKTSNPGSKDLQDLLIDGQTISQRIAHYVAKQNTKLDEAGYGDTGAVVGATYPEHAKQLRQQMPTSIFLVPGIGAQGDPALLKNFFDQVEESFVDGQMYFYVYLPGKCPHLTDEGLC